MSNEQIPQGIVAIFTGPDGRELATASDFSPGRPAGFSQKQAQEIRARRSLAFEAMKKLASPLLSNAIDAYDAEKHMQAMQKNGCKIYFVPVGYGDDDA